MFEVGFIEILLISILALVVLGPEKLPKVAQQVGRWAGRARAMARQFREQLEDEAILAETNKTKKPSAASTPNYTSSASIATAGTPVAAATVSASAAAATVDEIAVASATTDAAPAAPQAAAPDEDESSWYPPDHHAHPDYQPPAEVAPEQSDWLAPNNTSNGKSS
jgi:sec-independent protein translocase protein TatB